MPINIFIENSCRKHDGIWIPDNHGNFHYSDGAATEDYILKAVLQSKDLSSNSRELELYIRDWATKYHLARERSLAYQPLLIPADAAVLEVGAGCGAITRFFAERSGQVLAIEGSQTRARIAGARTRDLGNVHVLCAPFQEIQYSRKFDIIVCNGVFEYSSKFVDSDKPFDRILDIFRDLLEPDGALLLAIENQFGLRYWSSSGEDHTDYMFDGLEGYPRKPADARTFGHTELSRMLHKRFAGVETLFPLPDYKLPEAVVTKAMLDTVDCGELFAAKSSFTHAAARRPLISERFAWHELSRNRLLHQFANSFLFVAGNPGRIIPPGWLGSIFRINRKRSYTVVSDITKNRDGHVGIVNHPFEPSAAEKESGNGILIHMPLPEEKWKKGLTIHAVISRRLHQRKISSLRAMFSDAEKWWSALSADFYENGGLNGGSIDMIWHNAWLDGDKLNFSDIEWTARSDVPADWVICRAVWNFINREIYYVHRWNRRARFATQWQILQAVIKNCGMTLSMTRFFRLLRKESKLQQQISGIRFPVLSTFLRAVFLPVQLRQYVEMKALGMKT